MATFAYKVMDAKGTPATGQVDGDSKVVAAAALRSRGLTVLDLDEVKRGLGQIDILEPFQTIKARDLTVFSRQFATMVNSGLLDAALPVRARGADPQQEAWQSHRPAEGGRRGRHQSVGRSGEAPQSLQPPLREHGPRREIGGILDDVLNRLANQLERDDSIKRAVKSAMVYPIMIASFAILVLVGMVMILIPIFAKMYKDLGNAKLPLLTRIMMACPAACAATGS